MSAKPSEMRTAPGVPSGFVDGCSSAAWFGGFARPAELIFGARQCREEFRARHGLDSPVVAARTWLLAVSPTRGAPFDLDEVPAGRRPPIEQQAHAERVVRRSGREVWR